jgi:hypothetical protein
VRGFSVRGLPLLVFAALAASCSATAGLKPVNQRDPEVPCPGGRLFWNLQISDQRAEPRDSERVLALVRDSLAHSLPGCQWSGAGAPSRPDAATISIELHRFAVNFDGSIFDAAVEWNVSARTPSGQTLTEFLADATVSRPNYRGSNNEQEALQAAFEEAMTRTLAGLRNVPPAP